MEFGQYRHFNLSIATIKRGSRAVIPHRTISYSNLHLQFHKRTKIQDKEGIPPDQQRLITTLEVESSDTINNVVYTYMCPYAQRVWITRNCKEKIKLVPIDLQNRPDWYKMKVYLANKLKEGLNLMKYIDSHFEGPSLFPDGRFKENIITCFQEFAEELFSYTDTFNKTARSSLEGDGNEARAAFHYFETPLSKFNDGPFLQGQFSLADIACAPFIERCKPFLLEVKKYDITAGRPQLATWIEEMKNEAFNQTYKKRFVAKI
ncbi:glutathione S-transferase L2 [Citrus sinensis]|nr:glutathione S-transferase L2 [Citrus sinensis]